MGRFFLLEGDNVYFEGGGLMRIIEPTTNIIRNSPKNIEK
jgi:hypothetical protein